MRCPRTGSTLIRFPGDCSRYFICMEGWVIQIESCPMNKVFSLSTKVCVLLGSDEDDCTKTVGVKIASNENNKLTMANLWKVNVKQITTPKKVFQSTNLTEGVRGNFSPQSWKTAEKTEPLKRIKTIWEHVIKRSSDINNRNISHSITNVTMTRSIKLQATYDAIEEDPAEQDEENYNDLYYDYYDYGDDVDNGDENADISYQWSEEESTEGKLLIIYQSYVSLTQYYNSRVPRNDLKID